MANKYYVLSNRKYGHPEFYNIAIGDKEVILSSILKTINIHPKQIDTLMVREAGTDNTITAKEFFNNG